MVTRLVVKKRLIELCKSRDIPDYTLARISGVHVSTVKGIMNGTSKNPGIVSIKKICDGLEMSLTDFFDTDAFRSLEQEAR